MSKKDSFTRGTLKAGRIGGGSKKTLHDRDVMLTAFCSWLWSVGYQLLSLKSVRVCHVSGYISARLAAGLNLRTLQNIAAAIRVALRGSGRVTFANSSEISNKALGIAGASRKGKKRPITDQEFQDIYLHAHAFDVGLAAVLSLQRWLGLRAREAIMAVQSLSDWLKFLARGETTVRVVHGTKGGRPRDTTLHMRKEALEAIKFGHEISEQRNGVLIVAPDLKTALAYYHRHTHDLGLCGEIAPHSLRYSYACDAVQAYMQAGHSEREAQALAAQDLGHGSGRGRLLREIYGRRPKV